MKRSKTRGLQDYKTNQQRIKDEFACSLRRESCLRHWKHERFPRLRHEPSFSEQAVRDARVGLKVSTAFTREDYNHEVSVARPGGFKPRKGFNKFAELIKTRQRKQANPFGH